MSRSSSPDRCCTKPPNPWVPDSSGNYPRGGCNCDCGCVGKREALGIRYRSASPPRNIPIAETIANLDNIAIAFSNSSGSVKAALDAALIAPTSYAGSVGVIFSQDAAAAANANNLQNTLVPQAASVASVSTAIASTKASRLAYRSVSEATYALQNVNNVNLKDLATLVAKAKLAADNLVSPSNDANIAAQAVYTTASAITSNANAAVTIATAALVQVECDAATAACNAVPGSTQQKVTAHRNMIAITTAKTKLGLLTTAATKALTAENAANAVAIATSTAYIGALETQATAAAASALFNTAASTEAAAAAAFASYQANSTNGTLYMSQNANAAAAAAKAALPALQKLKDMVTAASAASELANIAASNARTLATSLDIQARNAAVPLHNPVTPQMIAKQTAAAQRFGAAAAAAEARLARQSAAPPKLPFISIPRAAIYNVRTPPRFPSDDKRAIEAKDLAAAKSLAQNPRFYTYINV
jgi:hypothetical protein